MIGTSYQKYVYGQLTYPICSSPACHDQGPYDVDGEAFCRDHLIELLANSPAKLAAAICDIIDCLDSHKLN